MCVVGGEGRREGVRVRVRVLSCRNSNSGHLNWFKIYFCRS